MRTFIAIELPTEIKDYLRQIQERLRASRADVKWVDPKNIHLTLKFLGEIDEKMIQKVGLILEEVAAKKNIFQASIVSLGVFPRMSSPRVVWVAIKQGEKEIKEIAEELEEKIARLGIPKEQRPFQSHITIGRTRSAINREGLIQGIRGLESEANAKEMFLCVERITLFKSTLTSAGPIYETLKEANLKAS